MVDQHNKEIFEKECPVCGSMKLIVFFEFRDFPAHCNLLWQSQKTARDCQKGDIELAFCPNCSFIFNIAFEPALFEYSQAYDNSLHFSPIFKEYAQSLAARLIERHDLYNKDIIEIGCGKGYFLNLICNLGNNRGVGFDPSYIDQRNNKIKKQVKFIQDYYSEKYSIYQGDLIVSRHVLEHIPNPKDFLNIIRSSIGNSINTHVFFEVPNALQTFRRLFIWDIIYEHFSYFTPVSLTHIFSSSNFRICELAEEFDGQFLSINASPDHNRKLNSLGNQQKELKEIASDIASFPNNYYIKVERCRNKLNQIEDQGKRIVLWGAGSKGVTFLNTFKKANIDHVVDINPNKQGMYIPGTGQSIVPPEYLKEYKPEVIIIMNPIYKNEIQETINRLELTSKFIFV
jgi:2-polyprenyl-3-methyl-5-hydroxy-6-metoxy-1,4-benzoquinol methylase